MDSVNLENTFYFLHIMPKHNRAFVFFNDVFAGELCRLPEGYSFKYAESYLSDENLPQIAFSLPKQKKPFFSVEFFPFFYGMLSEGANREIQERLLKIDGKDDFSLLVETAQTETIGAITVRDRL